MGDDQNLQDLMIGGIAKRLAEERRLEEETPADFLMEPRPRQISVQNLNEEDKALLKKCVVDAFRLMEEEQTWFAKILPTTPKPNMPEHRNPAFGVPGKLIGPDVVVSLSVMAGWANKLTPVRIDILFSALSFVGCAATAGKIALDAQAAEQEKTILFNHNLLNNEYEKFSPMQEAFKRNQGLLLATILSTAATVLSCFPGIGNLAATVIFTGVQTYYAVLSAMEAKRNHDHLKLIIQDFPTEVVGQRKKNFQKMINLIGTTKNLKLLEAFLAAGQKLKAAGVDLTKTELTINEWKALSKTALIHSRNYNAVRCALGGIFAVVNTVLALPIALLQVGMKVTNFLLTTLFGHVGFATAAAEKVAEIYSHFRETGHLNRKLKTLKLDSQSIFFESNKASDSNNSMSSTPPLAPT